MIRNRWAFLLIFFLLFGASHTLAAEPETHGYIDIHNVTISLKSGYADVHVTYTLDDAFRFLILMFGENDVKNRLFSMLNFENATLVRMDYDSADLKVYDTKPVYGDGLYWFPAHKFGTTIPNLTIISNQSTQHLQNVSKIPSGIVYY
ncbi:MAG TPA: hypothetical protein VN429_02145 [Methanospirillum sp.]|uniref:hypothetical protein n=1 Tax=Methanospirillum sp. TaxID=45200 RepID=UPI002CF5C404|nr:hypothetical protein [Methanospirillum sp.]HWQ63189.1 hypothetical protein [Methanospirillum sp.]